MKQIKTVINDSSFENGTAHIKCKPQMLQTASLEVLQPLQRHTSDFGVGKHQTTMKQHLLEQRCLQPITLHTGIR